MLIDNPALGFIEDGPISADYRVYHPSSGLAWHNSAWQRRYIQSRLNELGIQESFDHETDPRTERQMQTLADVLRIMNSGKMRWKWASKNDECREEFKRSCGRRA